MPGDQMPGDQCYPFILYFYAHRIRCAAINREFESHVVFGQTICGKDEIHKGSFISLNHD